MHGMLWNVTKSSLSLKYFYIVTVKSFREILGKNNNQTNKTVSEFSTSIILV